MIETDMPTGGTPTASRRPAGRGDLRRTIRLFRRFMGSPRIYWLGVTLLVFEAATAVVEPIPIAFLIDYLQGAQPSLRDLGGPAWLGSERTETILLLTAAIVAIAAINSAADSLTEVCMARGGRSLGYSIRVEMYSHLQRLPLAYHDKKRTGDVLTRVTGDVLVLEDFVVKSVSNILGSLLVLLGSFGFLLYKSWNVAIVAVIVIPMLALVSQHYSRRIKVASKTQRDREGDLASTAQEMLSSIRLVQSYGRGTVDLERFSSQTQKSMHASLGAANIQAQFSFVIAIVEALSIAVVIWLGVWLVDREAITIGTLVLFVLLLQNMFKPARKIVSEWYKIGKVFASVERIEDLLDREVTVRDLPDAVHAPPLQGQLTFRHVTFAYPAEHEDGSRASGRALVLDDIDFEVAAGEVVSLVGFSGAGKSTIAQLVPRLYDPDLGEVLVDGRPVRSLTLASLRGQVSLVLQDTVLLSGSVAENIGYGIAGASQADIEAAARLANAHEFIEELPEGYATQLGERGSTLSGGQRQRLAIARAFIRRAPILILDEPTTGLDAESSRSVVEALRSLMRGRSTIVISHDLGLIRCADRVLVISGGRIVESGPHEELMNAAGPYADLHAKQFALTRTARNDPLPGEADPVTSDPEEDPAPLAIPWQRPARATSMSLADGLREHLPGLARAMDEDYVARSVNHDLIGRITRVDGVDVGKVWVRDDGTCTLRYQVRLSGWRSSVGENFVLGRVHHDEQAAAAYTRYSLRRLPELRNGAARTAPWRRSVTVVTDAALSLHRFPFDPVLPTLGRAMNPLAFGWLGTDSGVGQRNTVEVVHHPREGACVLRYGFPTGGGGFGDDPRGTLYGKVYGDASGAVVSSFLRSLARQRDRGDAHGTTVRFPRGVAYAPSLRLLVTEALPGVALVPRLLESWSPQVPEDGQERDTPIRAAARDSGRALAALHGTELSRAPVLTAEGELASLRHEVEVVARFWPDVAEEMHQHIAVLSERVPDPPEDRVLSHGDFTPSQVLLNGGAPAVVDLDTLCWADPALDLGRFLAQLELRAVKLHGEAAGALVDALSDDFLSGYAETTTGTGDRVASADRIAFYRGTSLARSALHSCRQLKDHRLDTALTLLCRITTRRARG